MKKTLCVCVFIFAFTYVKAQVFFDLNHFVISKNAQNKDFEIEKVLDQRPENTMELGSIFFTPTTKNKVFLLKNIENNIKQYYFKYNPEFSTPLKIQIAIKKLDIFEKKLSNGVAEGDISLKIEVYSMNNNDTTKICKANSKAHYTRNISSNNWELIEKQLKSVLDNSLVFVQNFVSKNKSKLEVFATDSEVIVNPLSRQETTRDLVYYQDRKIQWDDFEGNINTQSKFGAAIVTSFGFESKRYVENHKLIVEITPRVYADKNTSWAKPEIKNDYALQHEQLHFDICYLWAMKFLEDIKTIKASSLDELISRIQFQYLEYHRYSQAQQEKYDEESNHSIIIEKQKLWENKIGKEIKNINFR